MITSVFAHSTVHEGFLDNTLWFLSNVMTYVIFQQLQIDTYLLYKASVYLTHQRRKVQIISTGGQRYPSDTLR